MTDPLGLIPVQGPLTRATSPVRPEGAEVGGPDFKTFLQAQLAEVNGLQQDARAAAEDLVSGRRDDVEAVLLATQKADTAFKLLMQVRNKMMEAYEEVKQIRF